jgi:hypothetical protein
MKLEHEVCFLGVLFAVAMALIRFRNRQSGSDKSKIENRKFR